MSAELRLWMLLLYVPLSVGMAMLVTLAWW